MRLSMYGLRNDKVREEVSIFTYDFCCLTMIRLLHGWHQNVAEM